MPLVYVVDDDAACRDSLRWLLESAGYAVSTFPDAERFLKSGDADAAVCLVLDLCLPGMSGLALQEALASRGTTLPIVLISAHGDEAAAAQALRNGAIGFLAKPFAEERLLDMLRHAQAACAAADC
ncbi:MAG TPA: response regulator [Burkholderiales bacterium]|nr:response regulator [Burkholderiales bacterium]